LTLTFFFQVSERLIAVSLDADPYIGEEFQNATKFWNTALQVLQRGADPSGLADNCVAGLGVTTNFLIDLLEALLRGEFLVFLGFFQLLQTTELLLEFTGNRLSSCGLS